MTRKMTRRDFLAASAAGGAGAVLAPSFLASQLSSARQADIMVGITCNTSPDWNGQANFMRALDESAEIGFRYVEIFPRDMGTWLQRPEEFKEELDKRGLGLTSVSGGGNFTDPREREAMLASNMEIVRFIEFFDCDHLKLNIGGFLPPTETQTAEIYREVAIGLNELGKRVSDMGMKFGFHPHLNSPIETRKDTDTIMEMTDPNHVFMVLDAGDRTMAGMDPLQLARDYIDRIVEFHLKDVAAEHKGGYRGIPVGRLRPDNAPEYDPAAEYGIPAAELPASIRYRYRDFCELGCGGVDFPAILALCNEKNWKGWFTTELNSTHTTSKASATIGKEYIEKVLKLDIRRTRVN
jgi:inosose dehydratase